MPNFIVHRVRRTVHDATRHCPPVFQMLSTNRVETDTFPPDGIACQHCNTKR
jgi:hypothetical protein